MKIARQFTGGTRDTNESRVPGGTTETLLKGRAIINRPFRDARCDPAFAGDDISVAKYYDFDKDFLLELGPCSTH